MASKTVTTLGVDHDTVGIRGARVRAVQTGRGIQYRVEGLHEIRGEYAKEADLAGALLELKGKLGIGGKDRVATCLAGKQVYVAQIPFRRLPDADMVGALRIEMRKSLPFDAATAAVDYQEIEHTHGGDEEQTRLVVTAVARNALAKHLKALEQAGLKVRVVDVLPLAVANAFWSVHDDPTDVMGHVLVHFQSDMCTVVIDGNMVPFYTRTIYFAAEELYGQKAGELSERERARRLMALGDELHRSLAFYEKTYQVSSFGAMHLYGGYFDTPELMEVVNRKVGLRLVVSPMLERLRVTGAQIPAGKFDVALGLAMRAAAV